MFRGPSNGGVRFGNRINLFISTNTKSLGKMKAGLDIALWLPGCRDQ